MSTKTLVQTIDDITGNIIGDADSHVVVTVQHPDGSYRGFDTTLASLSRFCPELADPDAGSRISPKRGSASTKRSARTPKPAAGRSTAMRTWLRENGYAVGDRGRISADLVAAYDAVHPASG